MPRNLRTLSVAGSYGEFSYDFLSGFPLGKPYVTQPESGKPVVLARVNTLEYMRFYAHIDVDLPDSVDVLDVAGVDNDGGVIQPEYDFRAEFLLRLLTERLDCDVPGLLARYDGVEVGACVYWLDDNGMVEMERDDASEGQRIHTAYGHLKEGGVEAWFDFDAAEDANRMADLIWEKIEAAGK